MKILTIVVFAIAISPFALGEVASNAHGDFHTTADAAHILYSTSVLAHGHRHGYEEGFHAADQDVQMGRAARDMDKCLKHLNVEGYRSEFGNKELYSRGYGLGFRAGYEDSVAAREFRPTAEVLGAQLIELKDPNLRAGYDQGLVAAHKAGAGDPQACPAKGRDPRFCDGFALGYLLRQDLGGNLSALNSAQGGHR